MKQKIQKKESLSRADLKFLERTCKYLESEKKREREKYNGVR